MIGDAGSGARGGWRAGWLPRWRTQDGKTRLVFWLLVASCTLLALVIDAAIVGELLGNVADYVTTLSLYWEWSKFLHTVQPAVLIYDPHVLFAVARGIISAHARNLPFAYPPPMLLLIWPLAVLPAATTMSLWLGSSAILYCLACWYPPRGHLVAMLCLIAPSTLAAMYYGQVSLLVAALIIAGCRLIDRRPILAGLLFGLAAVKPQFGLLIPVALVSARQGRAVIAATTTVLLTAIASGLAFGWAAWMRFPHAMTDVSQFVARHPWLDHLSPSIAAGLRLLGAPPVLADAVQFAATATVVVIVYRYFRRGFTPLATAILMVGALLATPYAWVGDLPMASYAVLIVVIERHRSRASFATAELLIMILVMALPLLMVFDPLRAPWGLLVLPLFFGVTARRIACVARSPSRGFA